MINPLSSFLDWIYPPACISCHTLLPLNAPQRFICIHCEPLFEPIAAPFCEKCGAPIEAEAIGCASCFGKIFHFEHNRSAFLYGDLIRDLLHEMKFRKKKRVAKGLGELWATHAKLNIPSADFTFIPMPLHKKKQRERGFNQAEILAAALSAKFEIPMKNILHRIHDTPPQAGLHPTQRAENVSGIFEICANHNTNGKNYILVDDIFTTGASLNECAKTLKNSGAAHILCMTFALTVKNIKKTLMKID